MPSAGQATDTAVDSRHPRPRLGSSPPTGGKSAFDEIAPPKPNVSLDVHRDHGLIIFWIRVTGVTLCDLLGPHCWIYGPWEAKREGVRSTLPQGIRPNKLILPRSVNVSSRIPDHDLALTETVHDHCMCCTRSISDACFSRRWTCASPIQPSMPGVLCNETQAGLKMHLGLCSRPFLSCNLGAQWQICEPYSATRASPGRALGICLLRTVVNTPWLKKRTVQTILDQVRHVC